MNRLTALRTFVAAVEHGSFAAAARATGLSNAAVSKNVRELEAELGVRLLDRTTRAMAVTDAGAVYHERMRALLGDLDAADEAIASLAARPAGRLRVTAPMTIGLLRLSPLVPRFLAENPGLELDLHLDDAKDDLIHGGFDLAIRGTGPMPDSTLLSRRLADLEHVVAASADYVATRGAPANPDELTGHPCLLYANSERPERWTLRRRGADGADTGGSRSEAPDAGADRAERTVRVSGPLRVNSSLALRDALLAGVGVASIPRLYVEEDLAAGRIVTVLDGWAPPRLAIYALYPPGPFVLPRVRLFVDFLAAHLRGFRAMTPPAGEAGPEAADAPIDDRR